MPGIAGFIKRSLEESDRSALGRMLGCMMHESGYVSGTCLSAETGVAAGWAVRKECDTVCQWSDAGDVGLVLVGDLFSDSPASRSVLFKSLLAAYEQKGATFLDQINGWFSGVLLDVRRRKVMLFNDRFGLGRVYIHAGREGFFFGSEAKALLQVLPGTRQLDERGLAEWLACGCVLQNRTLFSGIELLPQGAVWTFSADGKVSKGRYFEPAAWEVQPTLCESDYYERLKETFPRVLDRYVQGKEKLAMSLTGGLDGRMIMSWCRRGEGELPCFTFNGPVRDCADVRLARRVASVCGQPHETLPIDEQFFREFPTLAQKAVAISDGAMDVTGAAELYVNRLARRIAPLRLTGNYGSEILRSNVAFRPRWSPGGPYSADCLRQLEMAERTYNEEARGNRLSFIAFKQVPWHHFARFSVEQSQLTVRSPFLDNDLVALAFQAPRLADAGLGLSMRLIAEGRAQLTRIPTDRGLTYPAGGLANRLKRSFHEFMAKAEYAYDYGMPDWLARADRSVAPLHLERLFLGRQKFCHFRSWYRGALSEYIREILLDVRSSNRPYLKRSSLEPLVKAHVSGTANRTVEIHKLLSLELLQRSLLETSPRRDSAAATPREAVPAR